MKDNKRHVSKSHRSIPLEVEPLFSLGQVVGTPGAIAILEQHGIQPVDLLSRHVRGDWGDLDRHDHLANNLAVMDGSRIFSSYVIGVREKIYVITEATSDSGIRASTCVLRPEDY